MSVTTVRLPPDVEERLEALARKLHRTRNCLINQAVREFIQRQDQDQARWRETLQAMESVAQGRVVSGEAVHTWLRSWGATDELLTPKVGR